MADAPPKPDIAPSWRAACCAYRLVRQAGKPDRVACAAALAATRACRPGLSDHEISSEVTHAIAFASSEYTAWFWSGVAGR
jgi:hypothetical protein